MQNIDFENIKWYIEYRPYENSVFWRDSGLELTKEELDTVALDFSSNIFLNLPLNDDYSAFKLLEIEGKQTLRSLFVIIYNFYQTKIPAEDINSIFENCWDFYNELIEDEDDIKYIDAFDCYPAPPDFVGLGRKEIEEGKIVFQVDLGPL